MNKESVIVEAEIKPLTDKIIKDNFEKFKDKIPNITLEKFRGDLMNIGMQKVLEETISKAALNDPIMTDPRLEEFRRKCGI